LRFWGIGFGLPATYHPDEPAYVLQALAVARGLPGGLTFADPPLFKYVLLGEYLAAYAFERAAGIAHSAQEFIDQFHANPSTLYLLARLSSALFGALTVVAAGGLAARIGGGRARMIATGLCAVAYLLVREAHFGVNDTLVTLLVTLGLVPCVGIAGGGPRRDYLLVGVAAGLAFAAKYYGLVLLVPLVVAHVCRPASAGRRLIDVWLALAACVVAGLLAFPSLLIEPGRVVSDVYAHLFLPARGGYDGLDPSGGYVFYAHALAIGLGWPLLLAAVGGLLWNGFRRDRVGLVVGSLPVALLAVLGSQQLYFARFAMPAVPALIVEASLPLASLLGVQPLVGLLALVVVGLPTLVDSVRLDHLLMQTDTRTAASAWVEANLTAGARVAVDSAPLGPTLSSDGAHQVAVATDWSLFDLTPAEYRSQGIDYVVVSSFTSEARAVDPAREARREAFAAELRSQAQVIAEFRPYADGVEPPFAYDQIYGPWTALDRLVSPGPTIMVYRFTE
jgi:hypothetical protein